MTFDEFLSDVDMSLRPVAKKLNATLQVIQPDYTTKKAWGGWAYNIGGNYSCLLVAYDDHVQLMIMRGRMLKDPNNRLEGSGSNTRHVKFFRVADVSKKHLTPIMKQQFELFASGIKDEETPKPKKKQLMPQFVEDALRKCNVFDAYKARPPYQQNDYLGWIHEAKQDATKEKRLRQMLDELETGDTYMNMPWSASKKR